LKNKVVILENEMQDFGYRLQQLELNTDLEARVEALENNQ